MEIANGQKLFILLAGFTVISAMLPSILTQYNWMQPSGLATYEQRRRALIVSWLITILILIALYCYVKSNN